MFWSMPHYCWPHLPHQQHIRNTLYHYGTIVSNDFFSHIAKDPFDFKNRLDKHCPTGTALSTCHVKSLFTNIRHDLFYTAVEYWIKKLQNDLLLLWRFNKQSILEGLPIILEFKYFYRNGIYIHQIKVTEVGTKFSVVSSNLVVAYEEIKMFALLPQLYPQDFVDFFIRN